MNIRNKMFTMAALAGVVMGLTIAFGAIRTPAAQAATATAANSHGQCNGASRRTVTTPTMWISTLSEEGVLPQAEVFSKQAGFSPRDQSFRAWLSVHTIIVKTKAPLRIKDYWCSGGRMMFWKYKVVPAGTPMIFVLPNNLTSKMVRTSRSRNFNVSKTVTSKTVAQALCSNVSIAKLRVRLFVHRAVRKVIPKKQPAPKPVPKPTPPPSGSCNAVDSPGAVVCSTFYVIVTCGGVQINISGQTAQQAIDNAKAYSDSHDCNTVVTTPPPPCNCTPPPPPVCPPGTTGTPPNCVTPPTAPSVTITSTTTLNDIPEGKDSGPFYITVNASAAGSLTVDPGVGGVSDCSSSTPQGSITLSFGAGNSTLCVKLYAPMDASVSSMTITETAIVSTSGGTAKDVKSQTFGVSHPVRP